MRTTEDAELVEGEEKDVLNCCVEQLDMAQLLLSYHSCSIWAAGDSCWWWWQRGGSF